MYKKVQEKILCDFGWSNDFLETIPKVESIKEKLILNFIKIKNSTMEDTAISTMEENEKASHRQGKDICQTLSGKITCAYTIKRTLKIHWQENNSLLKMGKRVEEILHQRR